ncbi:PIN-like domain-containing protein [Pseudomonas huaxiensis]|uniref:PIN-like domain-containing protein n=1 Tax=Pseudomonas huaxiensis TaxID=2213017 RepID=UPI0013004323|nr:PIN-like domain-containing protein [Pseudomonas huaxiensis]
MKKSFPGHFANDPLDLKRLWESSLIVIDANVLLSLYRYSESTRNEFIQMFEKLEDRLWMPHQFAKEYLRGRLKVITDQTRSYDSAIEALSKLRREFEHPKQHPFLSSGVLEDWKRTFDMVTEELRLNKERQETKIVDDDVKDFVGRVLGGRVGEGYSDSYLEEIVTAGRLRYASKIPPGFMDAQNSGGDSLEGRLAPYGDYVGWLQLLDKAKGDATDIIFVTGDNKDDWWLRQSGKTIGPLPQLIEEFIVETSQCFYMYLPDRFLEQAGVFLHQKVSDQAMDEAREMRLVTSEPLSPSDAALAWGESLSLKISQKKKISERLLNIGFFDSEMVKAPDSVENSESSHVRKLYGEHRSVVAIIKALDAEIDSRLIFGSSERFEFVTDVDLQNLIDDFRVKRANLAASIYWAQSRGDDFTED